MCDVSRFSPPHATRRLLCRRLPLTASVDVVRAEFMPMFSQLIKDDQDTVRLLAAEACVQLIKVLPPGETAELQALLTAAVRDRSWRVRSVIADKWADLQTAFGPEATRTSLVPALVALLQDQEPEVRSQMAARLPTVGAELSPADRASVLTTNVLPVINELLSDLYGAVCAAHRRSPHVRTALAGVTAQLAPLVGKERALELIVPILVRQLKDEVCVS